MALLTESRVSIIKIGNIQDKTPNQFIHKKETNKKQ